MGSLARAASLIFRSAALATPARLAAVGLPASLAGFVLYSDQDTVQFTKNVPLRLARDVWAAACIVAGTSTGCLASQGASQAQITSAPSGAVFPATPTTRLPSTPATCAALSASCGSALPTVASTSSSGSTWASWCAHCFPHYWLVVPTKHSRTTCCPTSMCTPCGSTCWTGAQCRMPTR